MNKLSGLLLGLLFSIISAKADQSATLAWNPCPGAAGYIVRWTNQIGASESLDAGTNTVFRVTGLHEGDTETFAVTAYDQGRNESKPSAAIVYQVPSAPSIATNATAHVSQMASADLAVSDAAAVIVPSAVSVGAQQSMSISFPMAAGHQYGIQATTDLRKWTTVWQTTATSNSIVRFTDPMSAQMRFYRTVMW